MIKKIGLAWLGVFVVWEVLDFLIHNVLLMPAYQATAALWRPMEEMKMGVMVASVAVSALVFTIIYAHLVSDKRMDTGLKYGFLMGLLSGVGMAASYAVMPIPASLAASWLGGVLVEGAAAGVVVGYMFQPRTA